MKRISTHIDDIVYDNLVKIAKERGSSISRVVSDALFAKYGKKPGRPSGAKNKKKE
jgi:hypothetical protein